MQSNRCIWLVSLRLSIAVTHTHCSGVFIAALDKGGEHTTEDNGEADSCIGGAPVIAEFRRRDKKEPSSRLAWAAK